MNMRELRALAREHGRRGYSHLRKAPLIALIRSPIFIVLDRHGQEVNRPQIRREKINTYLKTKKVCPHCGKEISNRNWSRHVKTIHGHQGVKEFNFGKDLFRTDNTSLAGNFSLQKVKNRYVKKFKTYQDEYKIRVHTKKLVSLDDVRLLFEGLVEQTKKRYHLAGGDRFRIIVDHESLPHPMSTKLMKVADFDFENLFKVIENLLDYRELPIYEYTISTEVIKFPMGAGRLQVTRNNLDKKRSVIRIKNDDTMCLARAIVTAMAIQEPEKWTASELHNGIKKGRALQTKLACALHAESGVDINDWGNDFKDVQKLSEYLEVQINILDADQFNEVVYSSTPDHPKKIYLYKDKDHYDVITSMTGF